MSLNSKRQNKAILELDPVSLILSVQLLYQQKRNTEVSIPKGPIIIRIVNTENGSEFDQLIFSPK